MRRYSRQEETPIGQSYADLKAKQLANSRTAANSSLARNPENDIIRLPALNSMRRSASFASDRNTKFRLQNIDEKLEEFAAEVHNTRLETQVSLGGFRKPSCMYGQSRKAWPARKSRE
jgi:hypothetical protein